jgi:hypothetical protein
MIETVSKQWKCAAQLLFGGVTGDLLRECPIALAMAR